MVKFRKTDAGYVFFDEGKTEYTCGECAYWVKTTDRCMFHGEFDVINGWGSCNYFMYGKPRSKGAPQGHVTKRESGYIENPYQRGYSCKRCYYFDSNHANCQIVDKDSPGDTPGRIDPNGCCNAWLKHEIKAAMGREDLLGRRGKM